MTDIFKNIFFFLVKRAGRHFGFFKRAGRHEKGAGRRALQKKPRQNTAVYTCFCKLLYNDLNNCRVILDFNLLHIEFKTFVKMSPF